MRVLITGSAGLLGSAFEAALSDHHVRGLDLRDGDDARDMFVSTLDYRYDLVIHAAGHIGGRTDIEGRPGYLATRNAELDAGLFGWALRQRPGCVVYLSSSAVYPIALQGAASESWSQIPGRPVVHHPGARRLHEADVDLDNVVMPDQSYGLVKLLGERMARDAVREGLPRCLVVRPFSGYSEHQTSDYPFPAMIDRARAGEDPFAIWSDGTQVRDWIHVDDIVGATLAAVEQDITGPVNLGTGVGTSMNELAAMICAAAGYSPTFRHVTDAPRGVTYRVSDPSAMARFYRPAITLEQGIARALALVRS